MTGDPYPSVDIWSSVISGGRFAFCVPVTSLPSSCPYIKVRPKEVFLRRVNMKFLSLHSCGLVTGGHSSTTMWVLHFGSEEHVPLNWACSYVQRRRLDELDVDEFLLRALALEGSLIADKQSVLSGK